MNAPEAKRRGGTAKKAFPCVINLSVLGYREDDEWVALALEMDLRGYGETFEDAIDDLKDHVAMQISFARFKHDPDLIFRSAESRYFEIFSALQQDAMRAIVTGKGCGTPDYGICDLEFPRPEVIAELNKNFMREHA